MEENNSSFFLDLVAALKKAQSKRQIKEDIKTLGDIKVPLVGTLNKSKTKSQIKQDLSELNGTIDLTGRVNKKDITTSVQQATAQAQTTANSKPIQISFDLQKDKLINDIKVFGQQNTKLFKDSDMAAKYYSIFDNAKLATSGKEINNIRLQLSAMRSEIRASNLNGLAFSDALKKTFKRATELFTGTGGVLLLSQQLRQAWTEAINLDTAFTDLIKVQDQLSRSDYPEYLERCNKKAQDLAATQQALIEGATEFSRSGYDISKSDKLTEKSAILANVGEMSASDSAKAIISGVQAYDIVDGYTDVVDKAQALIDKYNEIGNTASITTAEIAQGVQEVGSVFADANTSVDQFIALLAAGNRQYQDADSLALGLRTAALRIRGCTAELEMMGEETEGVYTSASKLAEKIEGLTNIDGSGGVQILEADGETFRSIYNIFVDISKVYQQMSDSDASALLELIAGKHRASGISATLKNMSEAQEIYQRSLTAAGSAQEEYDKYLQSSAASLARFKASMTETYQSIISGETVTGLLNCGNATLQFANSIGLVESTLKGLLAIGAVRAITTLSAAFKASAINASNFGTALKTVKDMSTLARGTTEYTNALKTLKTVSVNLSEAQLRQVLANKALGESERVAILQTTGLTKAQAKAKLEQLSLTQSTNAQIASTFSLTAAVKGFGASLKAIVANNPVGIAIMAISAMFGALKSAVDAANQKLEEARQKSVELANAYKEQQSSLDKQIDKYKELKETLDAGNLSTEETRSIKEQLLEIQNSLIDSYGNEASNLDLVNGKYKEQLGLLSELSKEKAADFVTENRDVFADAKKALEKVREYELGTVTSWSTYAPKTEEQQKLLDYIEAYSDLLKLTNVNGRGDYSGNTYTAAVRLSVEADVESADELMHQFAVDIEEYGKENNIDVSGILDNISEQLKETWTDELEEYKSIYDEFMKAEIVRNDTLRPIYQQSILVVEAYNKALSSGEGIEDAKANLEIVQQSVQEVTGELDGSQEIFNGIFDGINRNAEAAYNLSQAFEDNDTVKQYAEQLRGLTDIDLKAINFDNENIEKGEEALKGLIDALGLTEEQAQTAIDKLVELGYVYGDVVDAVSSKDPISISDVFSLKDIKGNATLLSDLKDQLSEVESAYETCLSAKEEYDEQGYFSLETLDKLISLGDDYLKYLFDEEGNVRLDADAFRELAMARIDNLEAQALQNLADNIKQIQDEATATQYLAEKLENLAGGYEDVAYAALVALSQLDGFANSEAMQGAYKSFEAQYNQIKALFDAQRESARNTYTGIGKSASSAAKSASNSIKDSIDSYMNYMEKSLESGRISFQEYSRDVSAYLKQMFNSGKISAQDYFDYQKQMLETQKSIYDKVLSAVTRRIDKEIDKYEELIDAIKKENDALNAKKDEYDAILSVVESVYDKEIDRIKEQQDAIDDTIKKLRDENDEKQRGIELEKARWNLYKAMTQRNIKLYNGKEYIYTTNKDEVRSAQQNLADLELEETISALEKERDALDGSIDLLEEYKQKWLEIADARKKAINEQLAIELFGKDYEQFILQNRIIDIEQFKERYIAIQDKIEDNTTLIESYQEKIEYYEKLKEQWQDIADAYEQSVEDQYAAMILGANWEADILSGRVDVLNNFKDAYIAIQQAIVDYAWWSANEQIKAAQAAASAQGGTNITGGGSGNDVDSKSKNLTSSAPSGHHSTTSNILGSNSGNVLNTSDILNKKGGKKYHSGLNEGYVGDNPTKDQKLAMLRYYSDDLRKDEVPAILQDGEVVLTPKQQDNILENLRPISQEELWESLIAKAGNGKYNKPTSTVSQNDDVTLPELQQKDMMEFLSNNRVIPDYDQMFGLKNMDAFLNANKIETVNNSTPVIQDITITLPNVTNESGYEKLVKVINQLPLDAYQMAHRKR